MSWQTYVDEHLMCDIDGGGQHLTAAAIVKIQRKAHRIARLHGYPRVARAHFQTAVSQCCSGHKNSHDCSSQCRLHGFAGLCTVLPHSLCLLCSDRGLRYSLLFLRAQFYTANMKALCHSCVHSVKRKKRRHAMHIVSFSFFS